MVIPQILRRLVGVAPGTTTMMLGDGTYVDCPADRGRTWEPPKDLTWVNAGEQTCLPICVGPTAPYPSPTLGPNNTSNTPLSPPATSTGKYPIPIPGAPTKNSLSPGNAISRVMRAFSPYGSFEDMKGALGLILAPQGDISPEMYSEISATHQNRQRCGPFDAQFNTRGEMGYYYDSPLGGALGLTLPHRGKPPATMGLAGQVPSDLQLSRIYGYTPVVNSWVPFKGVTWTVAPWVPPNGYAGWGYPTLGPPLRGAGRSIWSRLKNAAGLGDDAAPVTVNPAQAAVDELKRHQDRVFALSVISTAAIASTAAINLIKHLKETHERRRKSSPTLEPAAITAPISGARRRRSRR